MTKRLARIGIIGAGYWATSFYLPFIRDHDEAECVGIVRKTRDGLDELQAEFNLPVATTDVQELLRYGCDGVVVASPHFLHREHAIAAIRAGAHVLIEKPMTVSFSDALAVRAAATQSNRAVAIAYGWNYSRMGDWAIELTSTGFLGQVTSLTGFMSSALVSLLSGEESYGTLSIGGFEVRPEVATWATPGSSGGGYLYGQMSHQLGLALAMQTAEPVEVFCRALRLKNDVDIDTQISVKFSDESIGSFSGSGRLPIGTRYPFDFRLTGTEGSLYLDFERERAEGFTSKRDDEEQFRIEPGRHAFMGKPADVALAVDAYEGVYNCNGPAQFLIDCCLDRSSPNRSPVELGVRTVAVMEAAERSSRSGWPVQIDSLMR